MRFFRRRQYSRVGEAIVEIAERHREHLGPQVTDDIEVDCRHGEEGIAFELLIEMLYEEEIESPPDERRVLQGSLFSGRLVAFMGNDIMMARPHEVQWFTKTISTTS